MNLPLIEDLVKKREKGEIKDKKSVHDIPFGVMLGLWLFHTYVVLARIATG